MRKLLLSAIAATLMCAAGAAKAASPLDGSDVITSRYGTIDWLIYTPRSAFLLDAKIDLSRIGSPRGGGDGKYTNRYWDGNLNKFVYDESGLDFSLDFDPRVHSEGGWYESPTRKFDFKPTADGFQVAFFGGDDHCFDGRTGHHCSQVDNVIRVTLYGRLPTGESIPVSWTFSDAPSLSSVPEPTTWMLMIGGLALVGAAIRRKSVQFAA